MGIGGYERGAMQSGKIERIVVSVLGTVLALSVRVWL